MTAGSALTLETVEFGGWPNCLRLANGELELIATTDVGPRIISLRLAGGPNLFKVFDETVGLTGGDEWHSYGGHRFWHAPESMPWTYAPDNGPVEHEWDGATLTLAVDEPQNALRREIAVALAADEAHVVVTHTLTNTGRDAVELAPWTLSVMAQGGRAIIPQEPYRPHPEVLTPARPIVVWAFTDMSDPRWTWGRRYFQLLQDPDATTKQKAGCRNSRGWAAYVLGGQVFVVRYPFDERATYPDFGCNTETFTDAEMLEVETLGPLGVLEPGASVEHVETWLVADAEVGTTDDEIDAALLPLVDRLPPPEARPNL